MSVLAPKPRLLGGHDTKPFLGWLPTKLAVSRAWGLGSGGLGFGVWGLGFGVWGLGFGVWGLGFRVYCLGSKTKT